jgi:acetylornithine deacetylase/succinyl-diaminopimelate desuccinylase-like protein
MPSGCARAAGRHDDPGCRYLAARAAEKDMMMRKSGIALALALASTTAQALPQRARANVNYRIFPGHSVEEIRQELSTIIVDPGVSVTALAPLRPSPPNPPLDPKVVEPAPTLVARYFPGVPLVPQMANGYTDATFWARSASQRTACRACGAIPMAMGPTGSMSGSKSQRFIRAATS